VTQDNNYDEYEQFRYKFDKRRQKSGEQYKDNSKRRLVNIIKKKFNTTIIGSLAAFEDQFGELWGHGLELRDLDNDQRYWRDIWMETRAKILDNGNANLRAAESELSQYTISWNRYITKFDNHEDS
tara:strand:+ start:228 stop:605 length:378 start_codon:yes stop_codon:yes gene_type:complete